MSRERGREGSMANLRSDSPICRQIVLAFLEFLDSIQPPPDVDFESVISLKECLKEIFKLDVSADVYEMQPGLLIKLFSSSKFRSVLRPSPVERTSHMTSSFPPDKESIGFQKAASDHGQEATAQPAGLTNCRNFFMPSGSPNTTFRITTQSAASTNHSAQPASFTFNAASAVDILDILQMMASQRQSRERKPSGYPEDPSATETRMAANNATSDHGQDSTAQPAGLTNCCNSPRTTTQSAGSTNNSAQLTSLAHESHERRSSGYSEDPSATESGMAANNTGSRHAHAPQSARLRVCGISCTPVHTKARFPPAVSDAHRRTKQSTGPTSSNTAFTSPFYSSYAAPSRPDQGIQPSGNSEPSGLSTLLHGSQQASGHGTRPSGSSKASGISASRHGSQQVSDHETRPTVKSEASDEPGITIVSKID